LGLPSGLFPSGFSTTTLYTLLLSPIHVTFSAHLILLVLNGNTRNRRNAYELKIQLTAFCCFLLKFQS
jgi:hypothetical protein